MNAVEYGDVVRISHDVRSKSLRAAWRHALVPDSATSLWFTLTVEIILHILYTFYYR